ncbi:MAG: 4Fe-4S binding protein [Nitrospirae bacterium]|nr:4Fe-4S binding protein [Nitrospirota bacterium]
MPIKIIIEKCNGCQLCIPACPYGAIGMEGDKAVLFESCVHCGICIDSCPLGAIIEVSESGETVQKTISFSNILVIGETDKAGITKLSREILGKAREFADVVGVSVWLIFFASDENLAKEAINLGADEVLLLEGINTTSYKIASIVKAISGIIEQKRPEIIFAGETILGCDVMPRIAQRFATGILSGCTGIEIDAVDRALSCTRPFFGRRIMGITSCTQHRPQLIMIKEGIFREGGQYKGRTGNIEIIKL